jgi:hypothetical protein
LLKPATGELHPRVYLAAAGLALWLVLSAWGFAGGGYADLSLAVVSCFVVTAVAVPAVLWRIRCSKRPTCGEETPQRFHDWASGQVDIRRGRLKGTTVAGQILLPIAAVAFGMTAFAVVFRVVIHSMN